MADDCFPEQSPLHNARLENAYQEPPLQIDCEMSEAGGTWPPAHGSIRCAWCGVA